MWNHLRRNLKILGRITCNVGTFKLLMQKLYSIKHCTGPQRLRNALWGLMEKLASGALVTLTPAAQSYWNPGVLAVMAFSHHIAAVHHITSQLGGVVVCSIISTKIFRKRREGTDNGGYSSSNHITESAYKSSRENGTDKKIYIHAKCCIS